MQFLIYAAMLIAALMSVVMGVDLVDTTPIRIAARPPVEIRHEATPAQPAVPSPPVMQRPAASPPARPAPSAQQQVAPQIYQPEQTAVQPPACNVAACTAAYRTFTPSDCTYQPTEGPRRLCSK